MRKKILIFLISIFCASFAFGDSGYSYYHFSRNAAHHIGISAGVGYGAIWDNYHEIRSVGDVSGAFGVEYEMRIGGFWMSLGPELQYLQGLSLFNTTGTDVKIRDTYGVEAMYHYEFDRGEDRWRMVFVNLPITLGYYNSGFYIGAGAKVGYSVWGNERTDLKYTTTGTYEEYIDDFMQMANHSYSTYTSTISEPLSNRFKVSVIGEIGYDVLSWYRNSTRNVTSGLKISACVEYGLNNLVGGGRDVPLYVINDANASELALSPFYTSRAGNTHRINPFYAGIKLTWLLCIKTKSCNCYENHQYFNRRFNNMVR
jgi:hypothetical protein